MQNLFTDLLESMLPSRFSNDAPGPIVRHLDVHQEKVKQRNRAHRKMRRATLQAQRRAAR